MRATSIAIHTLVLVVGTADARGGEPAEHSRRQASPHEAIRVVSYEDGTAVRYPVVLIQGSVTDRGEPPVSLANESSNRDTREMKGLARKGRFKVLAELVPGKNSLVLRIGEHERPFALVYQPQTTPYTVRVIYMTDSSGATAYQTPIENDAQDYQGKLDTAMKLMQTFTAERLHELGYGRRTFNLDLDEHGKVRVQVVKGEHPMAYYHKLNGGQLYGHAAALIRRKLPGKNVKNLVIPAFTRFDPQTRKALAHTALGGGSLALFGGGDLFTWPSRLIDVQKAFMDERRADPQQVFSDSVGRHTFWAIASTTMGAALHELGHTFGLPHSSDAHDIMTRGFDRLNRAFTLLEPPHARRTDSREFAEDEVARWAAVNAVALRASRWFALDDRPYGDANITRVSLDTKAGCVNVESEYGVAAVVFDGKGRSLDHFPVESDPARKQVSIPLAWLGGHLGTDDFSIRSIDGQGLTKRVQMKELLPVPFVQAWRFVPATTSWDDKRTFMAMTAERLKETEASALSKPPVVSQTRFVDFLPQFPPDRRRNVAGYALRKIQTDAARKVKILTGSDDALRVWLNGRPIQKVLALRAASIDQESTIAELRAGDNTLIAEVSQASGGWGLYLRLEDADGAPLALADDGRLSRESAHAVDRVRRILRGKLKE